MRFLTIFLAAMLAATQASAHSGAGISSGMAIGFLHPIGGLDHLLAMVAVGLFAVQLGGRATWLVPCVFLAMMAIGGALGAVGATLPVVELGIALSVVVLGGLVALGRSMPLLAAAAVIGLFAIFHGHAHGAEMSGVGSGLTYGAGYMSASALLIAAGVLAGLGFGQIGTVRSLNLARASGGAVAALGVLILVGLL